MLVLADWRSSPFTRLSTKISAGFRESSVTRTGPIGGKPVCYLPVIHWPPRSNCSWRLGEIVPCGIAEYVFSHFPGSHFCLFAYDDHNFRLIVVICKLTREKTSSLWAARGIWILCKQYGILWNGRITLCCVLNIVEPDTDDFPSRSQPAHKQRP